VCNQRVEFCPFRPIESRPDRTIGATAAAAREISPTGGDLMYLQRAVYNSSRRRYTGEKRSSDVARDREGEKKRRRDGQKERKRERENMKSKVGTRFGLAPATPASTQSDVGGPSLGAAIATVRPCHKGRFTSPTARDRMVITFG
jgi:hypothetical protein